MADTTTIGTQGYFGTVTDRIAAIATQGYFLAFEGIAITNLVISMSAFAPSVQMSVQKPTVPITAKVPDVKLSVTKG